MVTEQISDCQGVRGEERGKKQQVLFLAITSIIEDIKHLDQSLLVGV